MSVYSDTSSLVPPADSAWWRALSGHTEPWFGSARDVWYKHPNRVIIALSLAALLLAGIALIRTMDSGCYTDLPAAEMFRASSCDNGWAEFGDKCFKLLPRNDFDGGHKACERSNATVASVHSQEENSFVTKLAHETFGTQVEFFIGLEYSRRDKLWHWVDGSDLDYEAWQPGEPNNALGDEYCGEVWHEGPWNDLSCRYRRPIMCQKKVMD